MEKTRDPVAVEPETNIERKPNFSASIGMISGGEFRVVSE